MSELPTPMHVAPPEHEVALREVLGRPATLALPTIDQLLPFQCSTRVSSPELGPSNPFPTAQQSELVRHERPCSWKSLMSSRLGLVTLCQVEPSKCSVRVCSTPLFLSAPPTAQQSDELVHLTA